MTKTTKYVLIISVMHFGLYIVSFLVSYTSGMDYVLDGDKMNLFEIISDKVNPVLGFPLITLMESQSTLKFSGLWGYIPILLNSLVWAFFLYFGCRKLVEMNN